MSIYYIMQYKLRTIVNSSSTSEKSAKKVMGLTIPNEIAVFFEGCCFGIEKSGTCIVAYSGTSHNPSINDVRDFDLRGLAV